MHDSHTPIVSKAPIQEGRRLGAKPQIVAAHSPTASACTIAAFHRTIGGRVLLDRAIAVRAAWLEPAPFLTSSSPHDRGARLPNRTIHPRIAHPDRAQCLDPKKGAGSSQAPDRGCSRADGDSLHQRVSSIAQSGCAIRPIRTPRSWQDPVPEEAPL